MPHRSPADLTELDKTLQKITGKHSGKQILLAGDFNCPDINWDTAAVAPGASDRHLQQTLVDLTTAAQLTQIHEEPTRNGNTIDLVFSTNPSLIQYSASIPGLSDHEAVVADLDTCPQRIKEKPRCHYLFSRAKWDDLNTDLKPLSEKIVNMDQGGADVNTMWETFKTRVMSAVEKHIPSTLRRRSTDLPWIGHHIKKLLRRKKRLYKQARKTGN